MHFGVESANGESAAAEIYDIDALEKSGSIPALVEPADASQHSAVIDVLDGRSLVIKGPPGTGKSQTITNIISSLMYRGKKVLFVAQKQAALDVVRNNLANSGLGDYILEVFSIKASKSKVFNSIKRRVEKEEPGAQKNFANDLKNYRETKESLNEYKNLVSEEFGRTQRTIHELLWDIPILDFELPTGMQNFAIQNPSLISQSDLDESMKDLSYLQNRYQELFKNVALETSRIRFVKRIFEGIFEIQHAQQKISQTATNLGGLQETTSTIFSTHASLKELNDAEIQSGSVIDKLIQHTAIDETGELLLLVLSPDVESEVREWNRANISLNLFRESHDKFLHISIKEQSSWSLCETAEGLIHGCIDWIRDIDELKSLLVIEENSREKVGKIFDLKNEFHSLEEIRSASKLLRVSTFFSYFSKEWLTARAIFNDLLIDTSSKYTNNEKGVHLGSLYDYLSKSAVSAEEVEQKTSKLGIELGRLQGIIKNHFFVQSRELDDLIVSISATIPHISNVRGVLSNFSFKLIERGFNIAGQLSDGFRRWGIGNLDAFYAVREMHLAGKSVIEDASQLLEYLEVDHEKAFGSSQSYLTDIDLCKRP